MTDTASLQGQLEQLKARIARKALETQIAELSAQLNDDGTKPKKAEKPAKEAKAKKHYCKGTTQDDEPCGNKIKEGLYCHHHLGGKVVEKKKKKKSSAVQCGGKTVKGKACKKTTTSKSGFCHIHDDDSEESE